MKKINIISYLISAVVFFFIVVYIIKLDYKYAVFLSSFVFLLPIIIKLILSKKGGKKLLEV